MMSLSTIHEMSREQAEKAAAANLEPFLVEQEDLDDWRRRLEAGGMPRLPFPYPPLPVSLVPVAKNIIENLSAGGDPAELVELPEGIEYRGQRLAPALACVEAWHLEAFIQWPGQEVD